MIKISRFQNPNRVYTIATEIEDIGDQKKLKVAFVISQKKLGQWKKKDVNATAKERLHTNPIVLYLAKDCPFPYSYHLLIFTALRMVVYAVSMHIFEKMTTKTNIEIIKELTEFSSHILYNKLFEEYITQLYGDYINITSIELGNHRIL